MKIFIFILFLFLPLIGGKISAIFTGDIGLQYSLINQPAFSPPAIAFPVVWTVLFLLMGVSSWMVYNTAIKRKLDPQYFLIPYAIQLAINYLWSPIFWRLNTFWPGAWLALLLTAAVLWMILRFIYIKPLAAWLQTPYLLWCIFASYLSFGVAILNS